MYPIVSNSASQAIIDGRVIAIHLATNDDPEAALQAYEAERRPPTNKIVLANRGNGPDQVMQLRKSAHPTGSMTCMRSSARTNWQRLPSSTRWWPDSTKTP